MSNFMTDCCLNTTNVTNNKIKEDEKGVEMDRPTFMEQKITIEDKLESLKRALQFLYQDYHYHDSNNQLEILKEQLHRMKTAHESICKTKESYEEMLFKLEVAKKKRAGALMLLKIAKMNDAK